MAVVKAKPTSPGRRFRSLQTEKNLYKGRPLSSLVKKKSKTGGRNNAGRITTRHIGGGHKRLYREIDGLEIVPHATSSDLYTMLSHDVSGNYFDLDTTYLETGYLYEIQYSFYDEENGWEEQPYRFKFRVVD